MSCHGFTSPYLPGADLDTVRLNCVEIFSMNGQHWGVTKERAWNNHKKAISTMSRYLNPKGIQRNCDSKHSAATIQHQLLVWIHQSLLMPAVPGAVAFSHSATTTRSQDSAENSRLVQSAHGNKRERKGKG